MSEELWRLAVFLAVGALLWAVSLRHGMAEYGPQPVSRADWAFFVVSLALAGTYDWVVAPAVLALARQGEFFLGPVRSAASQLHPVAQVLAFVVVTDFLSYWMHRFMHTRRGWPIHAFHHSPRSLNWLSGMRGSPLHFVLILSPGTLVASVFLLTHDVRILLGLAVFDALTQNLMHSNVRLPWSRQLEWVFITPRMHFVHHHREPRYGDSNYGFNFAIWDHLFGTYIDADQVEHKGALGIDGEHSTARLFVGVDAQRTG